MLLPFCSCWMICAAEVHCTSWLLWWTLTNNSVGHDASIGNESDISMVNNLSTFVVKTRWLRWNLTTCVYGAVFASEVTGDDIMLEFLKERGSWWQRDGRGQWRHWWKCYFYRSLQHDETSSAPCNAHEISDCILESIAILQKLIEKSV
jgi:hypothetical protein